METPHTPPTFSPPKRSWQFSLKSLLIAMTAIAVVTVALTKLPFYFRLPEAIVFFLTSALTPLVVAFLGVLAWTSRSHEQQLMFAAAAFGAWTSKPFGSASAASGWNDLVIWLPIWGIFLMVRITLFAFVAHLALKFARNQGWSRF